MKCFKCKNKEVINLLEHGNKHICYTCYNEMKKHTEIQATKVCQESEIVTKSTGLCTETDLTKERIKVNDELLWFLTIQG